MTILIRSARLFSDYLGKIRGGNSSTSDCSCLRPCLDPDEFLVPAGRPIMSSTAGWMGESTLTMAD